jgi:3-phytase
MPMGISMYRRQADGAIFAIVAPKTGGLENYLWQYRLTFDEKAGVVRGNFVRRFGSFSGTGEIEAVAVDDEAGFVYYADEEFALRQWHADPDHRDAGKELAVFARDGFTMQREGIAIVARPDGSGFIVCSDQIPGATQLRIYQRQGPPGRPFEHPFVAALTTGTDSTDGLDLTTAGVSDRLAGGLLVMMNSAGRNFQIYDLRDVLRLAADGQASGSRLRGDALQPAHVRP